MNGAVGRDLTEWDLENLPNGWHVCPECDGDGVLPRRTAPCSLCHGQKIVAQERYEIYVRFMADFSRHHSLIG